MDSVVYDDNTFDYHFQKDNNDKPLTNKLTLGNDAILDELDVSKNIKKSDIQLSPIKKQKQIISRCRSIRENTRLMIS